MNGNYSETSENFFRSSYAQSSHYTVEQIIPVKAVTESCRQQNISLKQLPDRRLESGLSMVSFQACKASNADNGGDVFVFISRYNLNMIAVAIYRSGKVLEQRTVANQLELVSCIKASLNKVDGQDSKQYEQNLKASGALVEKLNSKCAQLCKQQKTQMMAMQKLKTTQEYRNLLEHQVQLNMQIQSHAESLQKISQANVKSSEAILPAIFSIEELKEQIEEMQYEYENTMQGIKNVKENLTSYVQKSRKKVQSMKIANEQDLNVFLAEAKKFKKLEYQKKFLH